MREIDTNRGEGIHEIHGFKTLVMRVLALLALLCVLGSELNAESPPYYGSGSGDDEDSTSDVVVITPTTRGRQTDTTTDSGSGEYEDDEDYPISGSGARSTTEMPGTTTERETTTERQTTTERETTTEATTTTQLYVTTTDDESDEFSGESESGSATLPSRIPPPAVNKWRPKTEKASTTDLYIAVSTTGNTLIIEDPTTKEHTSSPTDSTTTTKPSQSPTQRKTVRETIATSAESTTESAQRTTAQLEDDTGDVLVPRTGRPKPRPSERQHEPTSQSDYKSSSKPYVHVSTKSTTSNPRILAAKDSKKSEGFTLTTEVIAGVIGCALLALLLIAFLMYRLKKRDEGSYLLDESNVYHDDYKKVYGSNKEAFI